MSAFIHMTSLNHSPYIQSLATRHSNSFPNLKKNVWN